MPRKREVGGKNKADGKKGERRSQMRESCAQAGASRPIPRAGSGSVRPVARNHLRTRGRTHKSTTTQNQSNDAPNPIGTETRRASDLVCKMSLGRLAARILARKLLKHLPDFPGDTLERTGEHQIKVRSTYAPEHMQTSPGRASSKGTRKREHWSKA